MATYVEDIAKRDYAHKVMSRTPWTVYYTDKDGIEERTKYELTPTYEKWGGCYVKARGASWYGFGRDAEEAVVDWVERLVRIYGKETT